MGRLRRANAVAGFSTVTQGSAKAGPSLRTHPESTNNLAFLHEPDLDGAKKDFETPAGVC